MTNKNFHNLSFIIRFLLGSSKKYFFISLVKTFFLSLNAVLVSYIITLAIFLLSSYSLEKCVAGIVLFLLAKMLIEQLGNYFKMKEIIEREKLIDNVKIKLLKHSSEIPYHYLEDPEYLDLLEKSNSAIHDEDCIDIILKSFFSLLEKVLLFITYSAALTMLDWKLLCVVILVVILVRFIYSFQRKNQLHFFDENVLINRRFFYYTDTVIEPKYGKDFRLFNLGSLLEKKFNIFSAKMIKTYASYLKVNLGLQVLCEFLFCIQNLIIYARSLYMFFTTNISISLFSFQVNTAIAFSNSISQIFNSLTRLRMGIELFSPLISLLNIEKEKDSGKIKFKAEEFESLEFKNVYFKYPKSENYILEDVSFKINKGEKICIVGLNGAGKTTIVKLICRLFKVNSGDILINGISIYDIDYEDFIVCIATVFQDFKFLAVPINENICVSRTLDKESEKAKIENALRETGLYKKVNALEKKENTNLNPSVNKDGLHLSGGEGQRLALARCLYKDAGLIILDEPTSALDAHSEDEFYKIINNIEPDKTLIFISHRMSSAIFSDKILEIQNGKIQYFDTMENLLKNENSLFTKLYNEQKENYK